MSNEPTFTSIVEEIMRLRDAMRVLRRDDQYSALTSAARLLAYYAMYEQREDRLRQESNTEVERAKRKAGL